MVVAMARNGVLPLSALMNADDPPPPEKYTENGREYGVFRRGQYLFPVDEQEMDRMDIFHKFFQVARRDILHSAPFKTYDTPRILDLGTGTGIWAIDMASKYNADVHGWDLAKIQPTTIPSNLKFHQRDFESHWYGTELNSWDLIHLRMLSGSVSNWHELYSKVFKHLKPGYGWLEQVEIDMYPRCDDGTLPPHSVLVDWVNYLFDSTARSYHPLAYNTETRRMLESLGFVEIQETVIKVPINPWPTDPHMKDIGRWYNLALTQGLEALSLAPLARVMGWAKSDVDKITAEAKKEICAMKIHVYFNLHIWIARRPGA